MANPRHGMANPRHKVLVVDDVEMNRVVLCRILERLGYQYIECRTGAEALDAYSRHADTIACVLMDINMPEMDGLEAAFRIRQLEAQSAYQGCSYCPPANQMSHARQDMRICHRCCSEAQQPESVPIWAISACSQDEQLRSPVLSLLATDRHQGPLWQSVGIDAFLSKPVKARELLYKLSELESRARTADLCALSTHNPCGENWEEMGVKRRCSLSEPISSFARNIKEPNLQQRKILIATEAE